MLAQPPVAPRTYTFFPYTKLIRSICAAAPAAIRFCAFLLPRCICLPANSRSRWGIRRKSVRSSCVSCAASLKLCARAMPKERGRLWRVSWRAPPPISHREALSLCPRRSGGDRRKKRAPWGGAGWGGEDGQRVGGGKGREGGGK